MGSSNIFILKEIVDIFEIHTIIDLFYTFTATICIMFYTKQNTLRYFTSCII